MRQRVLGFLIAGLLVPACKPDRVVRGFKVADATAWPATAEATAWPDTAERVAIVIGVNDYKDPSINPLKGPVNDARRLSEALINYAGFSRDQVFLMTSDRTDDREPTRNNILRRLSNVASYARDRRNVLVLFAFAGHGVERADRAFLLPKDAQLNSDIRLLEDTSVSVDRIQHWVQDTKATQAMFILDACRDNPEKGRGVGAALSQSIVDRTNLAILNSGIAAFVTLYATAPGSQAYERPDGNGFFTIALAEGLAGKAARATGEVTLGGLIKYVEKQVPREVSLAFGKDQRPYVRMQGYRADELVIAARGTAASSIGGGSRAKPQDASPARSDDPAREIVPALSITNKRADAVARRPKPSIHKPERQTASVSPPPAPPFVPPLARPRVDDTRPVMLSVQNVNGARFVVDDVEVARNSLSTESRLTPGTHKLLVEKPGFRRHRATIFVPRTGTMDPVVVTMIPDDTE